MLPLPASRRNDKAGIDAFRRGRPSSRRVGSGAAAPSSALNFITFRGETASPRWSRAGSGPFLRPGGSKFLVVIAPFAQMAGARRIHHTMPDSGHAADDGGADQHQHEGSVVADSKTQTTRSLRANRPGTPRAVVGLTENSAPAHGSCAASGRRRACGCGGSPSGSDKAWRSLPSSNCLASSASPPTSAVVVNNWWPLAWKIWSRSMAPNWLIAPSTGQMKSAGASGRASGLSGRVKNSLKLE
jgi:hypothetical protein